MRTQCQISKGQRIMPLVNDILKGYKTMETLAHLPTIHGKKSYMKPIINEFLTCCGFRLSHLISMMNGNMVNSSGMDIYCLSKVLHRHRTALNMPTRETNTPRTFPLHLTLPFFWRQFPQSKISGILFF